MPDDRAGHRRGQVLRRKRLNRPPEELGAAKSRPVWNSSCTTQGIGVCCYAGIRRCPRAVAVPGRRAVHPAGGAGGLCRPEKGEKLLAVSLGFAGGVMLAVSFTDLFPTAREHLAASLGGRPGALAAVLSLAAGIGCAAALDHLVPRTRFDADTGEAPTKPCSGWALCRRWPWPCTTSRRAWPPFWRGMGSDPGVSITLAIALHNIPEGISVAMPVWYATGSRRQAFRCTLLSGLTEPVGAVLAFALLRPLLNGLLLGCCWRGGRDHGLYRGGRAHPLPSRQYGPRPARPWGYAVRHLRDAAAGPFQT